MIYEIRDTKKKFVESGYSRRKYNLLTNDFDFSESAKRKVDKKLQESDSTELIDITYTGNKESDPESTYILREIHDVALSLGCSVKNDIKNHKIVVTADSYVKKDLDRAFEYLMRSYNQPFAVTVKSSPHVSVESYKRLHEQDVEIEDKHLLKDGLYKVIINNYQKGAKLKTTPVHKIVSQKTLGPNKHEIIYDLDSQREVEFIQKVLSKKLIPVNENIRMNEESTPNIEVKHEGVLEVPEGKNVEDLPVSHFVNLAKKKGTGKITKALNNLQVWNKKKNPKLSKWAGDMIDKVNKKMGKTESVSTKKKKYCLRMNGPSGNLSDKFYFDSISDAVDYAKDFDIYNFYMIEDETGKVVKRGRCNTRNEAAKRGRPKKSSKNGNSVGDFLDRVVRDGKIDEKQVTVVFDKRNNVMWMGKASYYPLYMSSIEYRSSGYDKDHPNEFWINAAGYTTNFTEGVKIAISEKPVSTATKSTGYMERAIYIPKSDFHDIWEEGLEELLYDCKDEDDNVEWDIDYHGGVFGGTEVLYLYSNSFTFEDVKYFIEQFRDRIMRESKRR